MVKSIHFMFSRILQCRLSFAVEVWWLWMWSSQLPIVSVRHEKNLTACFPSLVAFACMVHRCLISFFLLVFLFDAQCIAAAFNSTRVLVGPHIRDSTDGPAQWRDIQSNLIVHPQYNVSHGRFDLMLFKITKVTLPNLKPIALNADMDDPTNDENLTAIGMGVNEDGFISNVLEKITITAVSHSACEQAWLSLKNTTIDERSMVCASTTGGKDVCGGKLDLNFLQMCGGSTSPVLTVYIRRRLWWPSL